MNDVQAIVLGVVEGLTEFLPVSSTGHLTIAEKLLGLDVTAADVTAYTAVIQMGAIVAVLLFFRSDVLRIGAAWVGGLAHRRRRTEVDYRTGWFVIVGSIPVGVVGLLAKDLVAGPLRSLWVVAAGLIGWSLVMVLAERRASLARAGDDVRLWDAVVVGLVQCAALAPGVSRSGATISAGLLRGLDRVAATRLSFFLSIPALLGAGLFELRDALGDGIGLGPTVLGTVVSFVVAYASVAWLLRFVARHSIAGFVPYRLGVGALLLVLLATGIVSPT